VAGEAAMMASAAGGGVANAGAQATAEDAGDGVAVAACQGC